MKLTDLGNELTKIFKNLKAEDIKEYSYLKYPRLLPMLKMRVKKFKLEGFGYVMEMETSMMGLMKLSTFSFTPSEGASVPYLLIDTMSMRKKKLAYVELYDCRKDKNSISSLQSLKEDYKNVSDYAEKDAWYIKERMEGSLIKCGGKKDEDELFIMVIDALKRYKDFLDEASSDMENISILESFRERMINEGNPSSGILNKILGPEKACDFFNQIVMPIK